MRQQRALRQRRRPAPPARSSAARFRALQGRNPRRCALPVWPKALPARRSARHALRPSSVACRLAAREPPRPCTRRRASAPRRARAERRPSPSHRYSGRRRRAAPDTPWRKTAGVPAAHNSCGRARRRPRISASTPDIVQRAARQNRIKRAGRKRAPRARKIIRSRRGFIQMLFQKELRPARPAPRARRPPSARSRRKAACASAPSRAQHPRPPCPSYSER